jgi:hypothetical protein
VASFFYIKVSSAKRKNFHFASQLSDKLKQKEREPALNWCWANLLSPFDEANQSGDTMTPTHRAIMIPRSI